ncbi:MAG: hypothetical protein HYY36_04005 [Gammaproteobacteria bacterium]|nr:hypothetical protein [Gammaproteobacteria bacterium]
MHSDGAEVTEGELREFCRGQIAHYKVPRCIRFVTQFPMTVTGKVQKFIMRDHIVKELAKERREAEGQGTRSCQCHAALDCFLVYYWARMPRASIPCTRNS